MATQVYTWINFKFKQAYPLSKIRIVLWVYQEKKVYLSIGKVVCNILCLKSTSRRLESRKNIKIILQRHPII